MNINQNSDLIFEQIHNKDYGQKQKQIQNVKIHRKMDNNL